MDKAALEVELNAAKQRVSEIEQAIEAINTAPENNVFESMDKAQSELEQRLRDQAFEDCEGAGNRGQDEYSQEFIVDGVHYIGTLAVEYNRHDKTYYFIDSSEWSVKPK
jgi:hypothetical protein